MPNDKTHGSPYKMKAGKMGPMQKNFQGDLAINKKLDKSSMAGGLTGAPSTGELDGPMKKKKGGNGGLNKKIQTTARNIGKNAKVDATKFANKIGLKKTSVAKQKAKKSLRKPGESSFQANKRITSANRKQARGQMKQHKKNPQAAIDAADKKFAKTNGNQVKG